MVIIDNSHNITFGLYLFEESLLRFLKFTSLSLLSSSINLFLFLLLGLIYQLKEQTTKGYLKKMYDHSLTKLKSSLAINEPVSRSSRISVGRTSMGYSRISGDVIDVK